MPHVHQVASLLKRWLLGMHPGAVTHAHLEYYLDEFTFRLSPLMFQVSADIRFNRRHSRSRGKLFYRLVQQAVRPAPYEVSGQVRQNAMTTDPKMWGAPESSK